MCIRDSAKAQKLKSITLGVNLDDLLRPKSVGVISLNDKEFTDSGILKRFMKFTHRDSELHHGNDVSGFLRDVYKRQWQRV